MSELQFSRNTKVYLAQGANVWEIPVLDGYSFSQATNSSEITLSEMADSAGNSRRARTMFNDSVAPAEWSFSTYVRPNGGTTGSAVEEALWANFIAVNSYTAPAWTAGVTRGTNSVAFDFDDSNKTALGIFDLYFVLGACGHADADYNSVSDTTLTIYKMKDCVSNSTSIDFEIDGIATIGWSGFGKIITEETEFDASAAIRVGVDDTDNFIRNRLTSLTVTASDTATFEGAGAGVYNVTLTGGSISLENGITYLTPETLCTVNQPIGHVTGTRNISGSFTCYLSGGTGGSEDLFEDLIGATGVVTNSFALTFSVGGLTAPKVVFYMPKCHLEVPTHSIEDVISVETNFHALPTTIGVADEVLITYTGVAP